MIGEATSAFAIRLCTSYQSVEQIIQASVGFRLLRDKHSV